MKNFAFVIAISIFGMCARAEVLPSDTDLRASYCAGFLKEAASSVSSFEAKIPSLPPTSQQYARNMVSEQRARVDRLKLYLLPRLDVLEAGGIGIAMASGVSDYRKSRADYQSCLAVCGGGVECSNKCAAETSEKWKKTEVCNDLSWLPY